MTAYTFQQLIDYTRVSSIANVSSGTFVGSNGLIQNSPQSRNLLLFTQQFDDGTVWANSITGTGVAATVTANGGTAPDGTPTADRLQFSLGGGTASGDVTRRRQAITTLATPQTFSMYLRSRDGVSAYNMHLVDASGVTRNIVVTGAWQRFEVTATGTGASVSFAVGLRGGQTPANSDTADVLAWGAQLELGSTATDYTRNVGGVFQPRFDYDAITLAPRGILVEEQRTNLLFYSEDISNGVWVTSGGTIAVNSTASPSGVANADALTEDLTTGFHQTFQLYAPPATGPVTFSVYVKANGRTRLDVAGNWLLGAGSFDLATGTVTGANRSIQALGNGWFRCIFSSTFPDTVSRAYAIRMLDGAGNQSYTGNGTSGIFIWGAQLEAANFATSYIPTVASQATRSADQASIVAPMFTPWFNAAAGTFVASFDVIGVATATVRRHVWNGSDAGNQRLSLRALDTATNAPIAAIGTGTAVASLNGTALTVDTPTDIAVAYGSNMALSQNGATPTTDASAASVSISSLDIGCNIAATLFLNGHIRSIDYYPVRLSDTQLQALTA